MKGLVIKDTILLMKNKMLLFIAFYLVIGCIVFPPNYSFIVGYGSFIAVTLVLNTMDYDEQANGLGAILTLPIDKKTYIREKYVYGYLLGLIVWLISFVLVFLIQGFKTGTFDIISMLNQTIIFLPAMVLILDIQIPIQIKLGAERSRFALIGMFLVIMLIGIFFNDLLSTYFSNVFKDFHNISQNDLLIYATIILTIIAVLSHIISFILSNKYMKNKKI